MFVKNNIKQSVITKYQTANSVDCPVENLWIEITKVTKKYIVGGFTIIPVIELTVSLQKLNTPEVKS